jgi:zinc transport system substrate-binding protein
VRVVFLLVAILAVGCGADDRAAESTVVAGFYPLAWAAERVSDPGGTGDGDALDVVNLTPAGAEPHDLELSPQDVELVSDARLVVYVGGGFQPALEDAVAAREGPSLDVLPTGERDPHVWLDPVLFGDVVTELAVALGGGGDRPELARELETLDAEYRRGLRSCDSRVLVTTHAAFGHLAARYRLEELSLAGSSPEAEPSPQELEDLVDRVRESGATTVFAEPLVSDRVAETIAREVGAEVAVLDPLEGLTQERLDAGEDYLSVMRDNLVTLREALRCR